MERIEDGGLRNAFGRKVIQRLPEAGGLAGLEGAMDLEAAMA
jgi:hypothetical protein